jgi:hypothetical protein
MAGSCKVLWFLVLVAAGWGGLPGISSGEAAKGLEPDFSSLLEPSSQWGRTTGEVESAWRDRGFRWNSAHTKDLGVIRWQGEDGVRRLEFGSGLEVEEVLFRCRSGRLAEISLTIWSKGDAIDPGISEEAFAALVESWKRELAKRLGVQPKDRGRDRASAARAERFLFDGAKTRAQLEFSGERVRDEDAGEDRRRMRYQGEFIRLRMVPGGGEGRGEAMSSGGTAVSRADIARFVVREKGGDVFIRSVPMIDQGEKGYCAAASAARVLNFYGIPADQHEVAQIAGTKPGVGGGTLVAAFEDALKRVSGKYGTRMQSLLDTSVTNRDFERFLRKYNQAAKKAGLPELGEGERAQLSEQVDPAVLREVLGKGTAHERFFKRVRDHIDIGIPLFWTLQLGLYEENGEPPRQEGGAHMRLIIGYNESSNEILFSDSWGPGHERKRINGNDAVAATMNLFVLRPAR